MDLNWTALVQPRQTLAVYMGVKGMDVLCRNLIDHGMDPHTPVAVVERGTTDRQRVILGSLQTMPDRIIEADVQPPSMTIIGTVVRLHEKLAWYVPEQTGT